MVVAPGCFDAVSGLIIKHLGFKATYVTGSGMEATMHGYPDLGLQTLTEVTTHAADIASATELPVICDGEAGFGGYVNIVRTIRAFEKAGLAAIQLEDQTTPPNSPSVKSRNLQSRDQAVGMIKAALDARTDPDFVVIAHCNGDEISIDELIERCNLYLDAGADLAMPQIWIIDGQSHTSLPSERVVDAHRRVCDEVEGPLLGLVLPGELTTAEIEKLGYKVYIYPTDALQSSVAAMFDVMGELQRRGTTRGYFERRPRLDPEIYRGLLRTSEWLELEKKYSPLK